MIIATPIPEASGIVIAKNPQISMRIPQTISPFPVRAADIELAIRTSSLNYRRQSSSSPVSRFHLPPAFCCNAWIDVGWRTRTLHRRVIVVLPPILEHKPQRRAQNKERSSLLAFGPSHLLLVFAVRYSLSRLARISRVDYKRKPT
jgi:hypothetical protein